MREKFKPTPENAQKDPVKAALERFNRQAESPDYNATALQHALDRIRNTGTRVGMSPEELYTNLAALSGIAVDLAGKHGHEADQQAFAEQREIFAETSKLLRKGGGIILPNTPSQPQRTTGRAAG